MKKVLATFVALGVFLTQFALADDHSMNQQPWSMTQVNLCYLNDGKTMDDVAKFNKKFFEWTKREEVDPYSLIMTPLANSSEPMNPTYDFVELLTGSYALLGGMWEKVNTDEGQKLLKGWEKIATCATRFTHLVHKYNDTDATTGTDNRVIEFNRCEVHPEAAGLIKEKHDRILGDRSPSATSMYWGLLLPAAGGESNAFRHLISYPDMSAYTAALAQRGTSEYRVARREYNRMYAACDGPSVWMGSVQNRPSQD